MKSLKLRKGQIILFVVINLVILIVASTLMVHNSYVSFANILLMITSILLISALLFLLYRMLQIVVK